MPRRSHNRHEKTKNAPRVNRWIYTGIIALVAVAATSLLIYLTNQDSGIPGSKIPEFAGVPTPDRLSMGNPDAPVLIEEYSDFQCPYCALFYRQQEPELIEKYIRTGKARLTYVPFSFIGPESISAAEAAYCAADQNKFWNYQYILFNRQGKENSGLFSDKKLENYASEAGLDLAQFRSCYKAKTYKQQVEDDIAKAQKLGVTGTPSFFVNGKGPLNNVEVLAEIEKATQGN